MFTGHVFLFYFPTLFVYLLPLFRVEIPVRYTETLFELAQLNTRFIIILLKFYTSTIIHPKCKVRPEFSDLFAGFFEIFSYYKRGMQVGFCTFVEQPSEGLRRGALINGQFFFFFRDCRELRILIPSRDTVGKK